MKKRFIFFVLLFSVCIALVIPKTHAFGRVDAYNEDSIYYSPFEYSINYQYSLESLSIETINFESITYSKGQLVDSYSPTLNFNNGLYVDNQNFTSDIETSLYINYSIYSLTPYEYYSSYRFETFGDPSFFNIKMNVPLLVLNYDIANMFSIQYFDTYCTVNTIEATMDLRYIKNGQIFNVSETLNLIDSVDSDSLYYKPLLDTFNSLFAKYEVNEFVITNYNLFLDMNSDSNYYIISHPLFENGYAFEVPYLVTEVEEVVNPDFGSWLTSSLSGFFDFEIVEGWSFGVIFALIVAIPIILYLLKYFFGG